MHSAVLLLLLSSWSQSPSTPHSDTQQPLSPPRTRAPLHQSMSAMDAMNDSFSYGWALNKPLVDFLSDSRRSFDTLDGASFIEMDPHFLSRRWTIAVDDFDFDVPRSSSSGLVLADQIFCDGYLVPCPVSGPLEEALDAAASGSLSSATREDYFPAGISLKSLLGLSGQRQPASSCFDPADRPRRSASSDSSPVFHSARSTPSSSLSRRSHGKELKSPLINNYMKSPRKILLKYLYFLIPLYKKILKGFRIKISASRSSDIRSADASARSSPRTSSAFSSIEWCRSNADISISDAILYCKRSNGQYNK